MVNKVILVGGLTRDADALTGSRGAVTRMRLATSRHWRDAEGTRQEAVEYHTLVAFNRLAEICAQRCTEGRCIYVEGRLRTREYVGQDGSQRMRTEIVVEVMRLLERRQTSALEGPSPRADVRRSEPDAEVSDAVSAAVS
ncbi:MAG TPA: single-stranded DNA-binding protein [Candidatus Angelobacter sp.]|jgi:single-strand DNA-binding protein|nr:single-stranded DNA-binding protein [Candidatus Angelobacter sp.]